MESLGMKQIDVGKTFKMNVKTLDGHKVIHSNIDHLYALENVDLGNVQVVEAGFSDHDMIKCELRKLPKQVRRFLRSEEKRSFKNYTPEAFQKALIQQPWEKLGETEDVNEMLSLYEDFNTRALDLVAPVKTFKIQSNYKWGLSDETKEMMAKHPTAMIEMGVRGMLPKNRLGRAVYRNLYVYAGTEHGQTAQQPKLHTITR